MRPVASSTPSYTSCSCEARPAEGSSKPINGHRGGFPPFGGAERLPLLRLEEWNLTCSSKRRRTPVLSESTSSRDAACHKKVSGALRRLHILPATRVMPRRPRRPRWSKCTHFPSSPTFRGATRPVLLFSEEHNSLISSNPRNTLPRLASPQPALLRHLASSTVPMRVRPVPLPRRLHDFRQRRSPRGPAQLRFGPFRACHQNRRVSGPALPIHRPDRCLRAHHLTGTLDHLAHCEPCSAAQVERFRSCRPADISISCILCSASTWASAGHLRGCSRARTCRPVS